MDAASASQTETGGEAAALVARYVAGRTVACPGCGRTLPSVEGVRCPCCGEALVLCVDLAVSRAVPAFVFGLLGLAAGAGFAAVFAVTGVLDLLSLGAGTAKPTTAELLVVLAPIPLAAVFAWLMVLWIRRRHRFRARGPLARSALAVGCWVGSAVVAAAYFGVLLYV